MAQREKEKARRTTARSARAASPVQETAASLESRLRDAERERDRLRLELKAERARVAALEESRRQAASLIDWIIDSLRNLIDKDA